jgi:hypothetical protein
LEDCCTAAFLSLENSNPGTNKVHNRQLSRRVLLMGIF